MPPRVIYHHILIFQKTHLCNEKGGLGWGRLKKNFLNCNKKQTCHVKGEEVMSHLLPTLPKAMVVPVTDGNESRAGCKDGALDALHFYEASS